MPFLFFDPFYFMFALPAMAFAMWAQYKVRSTFSRYSQVPNRQRVGGLDVARILMQRESLEYLRVNRVPGDLTDFYNPGDKSINLSEGSTNKPSVAAMAVVAHELGHAEQDKEGYAWMRVRAGIVGIANIGQNFGYMLFFVGLMFGAFAGGRGGLGWNIALLGALLFAGAVAFTLVTLPVEFNASRRARQMLHESGLITTQEEAQGVSAVLNAAALTYVAGAAQSISQLLYLFFILFSGSRRS